MADAAVPEAGCSWHQDDVTVGHSDKKEEKPRSFGRDTQAVPPTVLTLVREAGGSYSASQPKSNASIVHRHFDNAKTISDLSLLSNASITFIPQMLPPSTKEEVKKSEATEFMYVKEARLLVTLTNRAVELNQRLLREYQQGSLKKSFSDLLTSVQRCLMKCRKIRNLPVDWDPPEIKLGQLNQKVDRFEKQVVHFLATCQPDQDEAGDHLLMCVWFAQLIYQQDAINLQSARHRIICRKIASMFIRPVAPIDYESAWARLCAIPFEVSKDSDELNPEELPGIVFITLKQVLTNSGSNIHCKDIIKNIEEFVKTDPLFNSPDICFTTLFNKCMSEMSIILMSNHHNYSGRNKHNQTFHDSMNAVNTYDLLRHVMNCIGFSVCSPSSPGIALVALKRIFANLSVPKVREELEFFVESIDVEQKDNNLEAQFSLYQFLLKGTCDTHKVLGYDLKSYVMGLCLYLHDKFEMAEQKACQSYLPEAFWLAGIIREQKGNLAGAVESFSMAVDLGLESAKLKLASLLLKSEHSDWQRILSMLSAVDKHYQHMGREDLARQVQYVIDMLEQNEEPSGKDMSAPGKKKSKTGKKSRSSNPTDNKGVAPAVSDSKQSSVMCEEKQQKPVTGHDSDASEFPDAGLLSAMVKPELISLMCFTRHEMALLNISVTQAMASQNYDAAYQLLTEAGHKINWVLQQASIAQMDLWRLRALSCDHGYLTLLNHSARHCQKTITFNTIDQQGDSLADYGLNRQSHDEVALTMDLIETKSAIRRLVIDKAIRWLCLLHPSQTDFDQYKKQWQENPVKMAKSLLLEFEHSLPITFVTGSFLSTLGHIHGDMARECSDRKRGNRLKLYSQNFYNSATKFNAWRNNLKSNHKLSRRIASQTPLGDIQRIKKVAQESVAAKT